LICNCKHSQSHCISISSLQHKRIFIFPSLQVFTAAIFNAIWSDVVVRIGHSTLQNVAPSLMLSGMPIYTDRCYNITRSVSGIVDDEHLAA